MLNYIKEVGFPSMSYPLEYFYPQSIFCAKLSEIHVAFPGLAVGLPLMLSMALAQTLA
jgi:hypothetical protein